jgi:glycosyltransferase involved in cell wall biosynthesis
MLNNHLKISICIPTWEQYGYGVGFLRKNLDSILSQTFKNYNVIISDHSVNSEIEFVVNEYESKLDIKYLKYSKNRGNGPSNTNNSILNADGDVIKIMFQDDFFYKENALELIVKQYENNDCNWLVNGCNHTNDDGKTFSNFMVPLWNDQIATGVNTISSPSVLSFRNINPCLFDENLTMLMDCDMYYQLYIRYGLPKIITDPLITNRMHENQISSLYKKDIHLEINYVKNKYNI